MKRLAHALLAACLAWTLTTVPVEAEETPFYRVEVIVLTHSDGRSDARETAAIESFSDLIDPLRQARIAAWEAETEALDPAPTEPQVQINPAELEAQRQASEALDLFSAIEALEAVPELLDEHLPDPGPIYPDPFIQIEGLSPAMQQSWDRLAASGEFRPVAWRAWYQPLTRTRLSPPVRVHDEVPLRLDVSSLIPAALPGLGQASQVQGPMLATDYRLDGSLRLRQRQFMHVELDLHWREVIETEPFPVGPLALDKLPASGYRLHRLNQSRTVRPGRLEYFDSSWLGVLVLIEPWQPPEAIEREIP